MSESNKNEFSNYVVGLLPVLVQVIQVEVVAWADRSVSQEVLNAIIAARVLAVLIPPEGGAVAAA